MDFQGFDSKCVKWGIRIVAAAVGSSVGGPIGGSVGATLADLIFDGVIDGIADLAVEEACIKAGERIGLQGATKALEGLLYKV
jgi:hypothetical protein